MGWMAQVQYVNPWFPDGKNEWYQTDWCTGNKVYIVQLIEHQNPAPLITVKF